MRKRFLLKPVLEAGFDFSGQGLQIAVHARDFFNRLNGKISRKIVWLMAKAVDPDQFRTGNVMFQPFGMNLFGNDRILIAGNDDSWYRNLLVARLENGVVAAKASDLPRIRSWVERAGYQGFHEVEIFSELDWWRREPDEVLETCKDRHQRFC